MITISDFSKRYDLFEAVHTLNLHVPEGKVYGLIGSNGAGKTTIMRFLATLIEPTRGMAMVNGYSVTAQLLKVRQSVGYMPDQFGVYPGMRVWEFIDFFAAAYGIERWKRANLIGDLLGLVDLDAKRYDLVDTLSRGMKQRLGLAKTLVHDPPVLLLDEPASGLDPRARLEIQEFLRELAAMGKTILVSSHILSELADICSMIGILERGRLLASGTLEEVLAQVRLHRVFVLRILDGADKAYRRLHGNSMVFDIEIGLNEYRFGFHGGEEEASNLLAELVRDGVRVLEFREKPVDLEEAFFQLTRGEVA